MAPRVPPALPYLAFDTSGAAGSVALGNGNGASAVVTLEKRDDHAALLVPAIDEVLARARVGLAELSGIIVGEGPGSFTGVRVAAATAKALAGALGIRLFPVSSLAAAALASGLGPSQYVLFDARGERIYGACFEIEAGCVSTVIAPHGGDIREVLEGHVPRGCVFTGDASVKHRGPIEGAGFEVAEPPDDGTSLAEGLLRRVGLRPDLEPVQDAATWEPRYVRASAAERSWNV